MSIHKDSKVAMVGSGSWATALAKIIMCNVDSLSWYFRKEETIEEFRKYGHNPRYLRGVEFELERIKFYNDINQIIEDNEIIIIAIPSAFLNGMLSQVTVSWANKYIVSAVKGIVPETNEVICQYMHNKFGITFERMSVIAGPCHAEEVALERLSYLTIACPDLRRARFIADLIQCPFINANVSDDIWGTEYASVLKNIIAIASGIMHGLRHGDNFQAVLVSNAAQEIQRFIDKVHPIDRDIVSSAYLGDLLVTAYSQFSRNRTFGTMVGKGYTIKTAQLEMHMVAEGYYASKCLHEINEDYKVNLPICNMVYNVLYGGASASIEALELTKKLR
ncbi:MAG: NAD(P)H-dependent glycerol-3-phosphate dehydrogenase [Mangrovibacterium sp.]